MGSDFSHVKTLYSWLLQIFANALVPMFPSYWTLFDEYYSEILAFDGRRQMRTI